MSTRSCRNLKVGLTVPVGFLTEDQASRYGRFAGEPTHDQLDRHFHHDDADRAFVAEHRPPPTRGGSRRRSYRLRLDSVVSVPKGERQSPLDRLRDGPFIQSGPEISRSLLRLGEVHAFVQELPKIDRIPRGKVTALEFDSVARA